MRWRIARKIINLITVLALATAPVGASFVMAQSGHASADDISHAMVDKATHLMAHDAMGDSHDPSQQSDECNETCGNCAFCNLALAATASPVASDSGHEPQHLIPSDYHAELENELDPPRILLS